MVPPMNDPFKRARDRWNYNDPISKERPMAEVTTEDLRATLLNYPETESARKAAIEWKRRMGSDFNRKEYR
jgi:hypothetical protein